MRSTLVAGNWKMHLTLGEARSLAREIRDLLGARGRPVGAEVVLCPPFPALPAVAEELVGSPIKLGAQNVFWESEGAFTGEVSAPMLRAAGVHYVIVGHSERRRLFGETDKWVARKLRAALGEDLVPIVCLGETLEERESGATGAAIENQIAGGLGELGEDDWARVVIAYEPVWAIGTGRTATPELAAQTHRLIRDLVRRRAGAQAEEVLILYGGSVQADNAPALLANEEIDGALVGGASLRAESFVDIVRSVEF